MNNREIRTDWAKLSYARITVNVYIEASNETARYGVGEGEGEGDKKEREGDRERSTKKVYL